MKYADEMGSSAMIYMPTFINTGSAIKRLMGGRIHTQVALRSHKPIFFKIRNMVMRNQVASRNYKAVLMHHYSSPGRQHASNITQKIFCAFWCSLVCPWQETGICRIPTDNFHARKRGTAPYIQRKRNTGRKVMHAVRNVKVCA
jgi:hypothetical protein